MVSICTGLGGSGSRVGGAGVLGVVSADSAVTEVEPAGVQDGDAGAVRCLLFDFKDGVQDWGGETDELVPETTDGAGIFADSAENTWLVSSDNCL